MTSTKGQLANYLVDLHSYLLVAFRCGKGLRYGRAVLEFSEFENSDGEFTKFSEFEFENSDACVN